MTEKPRTVRLHVPASRLARTAAVDATVEWIGELPGRGHTLNVSRVPVRHVDREVGELRGSFVVEDVVWDYNGILQAPEVGLILSPRLRDVG